MATATRTCTYCKFGNVERFHDCRTVDLPRATRRDGNYAMRRIDGEGHVMFVDIPDTAPNREADVAGTSYVVGHVMDPDNFHTAVDAAQEEAHVLAEQARAEFA